MGSTAVGSKDEDRVKKHSHCLGEQNMRRIWQLVTLSVIGEEGKTDFEMSGFQRLSISILLFGEGDWASGISSTDQGQDAEKAKIGREDKS